MLEELLDLGYLLDPPPASGGAVDFVPGSTQYLSRADDDSLDVAQTDSVYLQVLAISDVEDDANTRVLAGKKSGASAQGGYHLRKANAGDMVFGTADGVDQANNTYTSPSGILNWHVWGGYIDSTSGSNRDIGIVQDGTADPEVNSTVLGSLAQSTAFQVGATPAPGLLWDGKVAYCRLWIKAAAAWTQGELDRFMEARRRLYLPAGWAPGGTMRLQWIMWDLNARDYSGNGLAGTYNGAPSLAADPAGYVGPGGSPYKFGKAAAAVVKHRRTLLGVGV